MLSPVEVLMFSRIQYPLVRHFDRLNALQLTTGLRLRVTFWTALFRILVTTLVIVTMALAAACGGAQFAG